VVAGVTWIAVPPQHGVPPAGAATPSATGLAGPALGNDGQQGTHDPTAGPSAAARASVLPTAGGGSGAASPAASVTAVPSPASESSAAAGPTASTSTSDPPAAGTLSVSPATLDLTPPGTGTITLTATGGSVNWSVSEPSGLEKKVVVAPVSGTLAAGASTTVSVTVACPGKPRVHLTFSPSGTTVTVVIS